MTEEIKNEQETPADETTVTTQDKKAKTFTQDELNALLAQERRKAQQKLEAIQNEYTSFKAEVETERSKQEEKLKAKVDEMKAGLPENILKLLSKLTYSEQAEWLAENKIEKKTIPPTPEAKTSDGGGKPKSLGTII